tara:strand:- start:342 stop:1373 length:1032 start_codon:yes stop_codon:yes gene_type:complete
MDSINIAVVGFGLIGKKHASIIQDHKKLNLCGIVENNKKPFNEKNLKCNIFYSIDELLKNEKVDGAVISTPTLLHMEHSKKFIEKKIPILIEKPISNSSKEVEILLDLANRNSTRILVGHHRRHNNLIKVAKKTISEGLIGKLRSASTICWFYKPNEYFDEKPWRKQNGAGPISTNLIHDVDLLRYFCGEVKDVYAFTSPSMRRYKNEDLASVILQFDTGVTATLSVSDSIVSPWSWEMNSKENLDFPFTNQNCYLLGGTKGSLSIPELKIWHHEDQNDWRNLFKTKKLDYKTNNPLIDQLNHFCEIIESKIEPIVSGEEGLKSLKVIEAIKQSSKRKKNISI